MHISSINFPHTLQHLVLGVSHVLCTVFTMITQLFISVVYQAVVRDRFQFYRQCSSALYIHGTITLIIASCLDLERYMQMEIIRLKDEEMWDFCQN